MKTIVRIWRFYVDGFKQMTIGKTLWLLILIKLFIIFCILKVFFFPNFLNSVADNDDGKEEYVSSQLIQRTPP